jgi:hypothetical protein
MRKHYTLTQEREREELFDDLCRRALSQRSELELYLGYERKMIAQALPDFKRAKDIYVEDIE